MADPFVPLWFLWSDRCEQDTKTLRCENILVSFGGGKTKEREEGLGKGIGLWDRTKDFEGDQDKGLGEGQKGNGNLVGGGEAA